MRKKLQTQRTVKNCYFNQPPAPPPPTSQSPALARLIYLSIWPFNSIVALFRSFALWKYPENTHTAIASTLIMLLSARELDHNLHPWRWGIIAVSPPSWREDGASPVFLYLSVIRSEHREQKPPILIDIDIGIGMVSIQFQVSYDYPYREGRIPEKVKLLEG